MNDMREIVYVYLIHMRDIICLLDTHMIVLFIGYTWKCKCFWILMRLCMFIGYFWDWICLLDTHEIVYVNWICV